MPRLPNGEGRSGADDAGAARKREEAPLEAGWDLESPSVRLELRRRAIGGDSGSRGGERRRGERESGRIFFF